MEVVWLLDGNTLASLRRALQPPTVSTDGSRKRARIPLEAFVAEIYRAICLRQSADHGSIERRNQTETRQLVERTCVLFDLVDVDSVGVVDWEDFTDFCVYMRGRDTGNQGLEEDEPGAQHGGGRSQPDDITRFVEKLGYNDRSSHCHEVCCVCPRLSFKSRLENWSIGIQRSTSLLCVSFLTARLTSLLSNLPSVPHHASCTWPFLDPKHAFCQGVGYIGGCRGYGNTQDLLGGTT